MNPKIKYYPNGNKEYEYYVNDLDQFHNENGPAYILYYENGNKEIEEYYINNELHNINGPARVCYFNNVESKDHHSYGVYIVLDTIFNTIPNNKRGNIESKGYYLNGIYIDVSTDEEFQKYIKRLNIS